MFGLREYIIAARGQHWPANEGLVLAQAGADPVAVIRAETWPEVRERPWPDGTLKRPWLWRLLGIERDPEQVRTVIRRLADGYPLARLHRRAPLFHRTVGIFDGADHRVAYCRWDFKGTGSQDEFCVVRADHSLAGKVQRAGEAEYRVLGADGGTWAVVAGSGRGSFAAWHVSIADSAVSEGRDGVLLLAAVIVLYSLVSGGRDEPRGCT